MSKVTIEDKTFRPYLKYEEIQSFIDALAQKVNADYVGGAEPVALLCVLNGAIMFTAEIMKRLNFPLELVSMKLSSYEGMRSSGNVRQVLALSGSVEGKRVIICEDVVDTGTTIQNLKKFLVSEGAVDVKVCTMLFKPDVYLFDDKPEYVGKNIPNDFIVGFGLDYNEYGRNYKDIYVIDK